MSTCADLREDLALEAQGLLDEAPGAVVRAHVARCRACAAEIAALRATLDLVRAQTELAPTAAETDALFAAVEAELGRSAAPLPSHPAWRRTWDHAVSRYENSARFRRVTIASIALHAAAAASVAWLLIGGGGGTRRADFGVAWERRVAVLEEDTQRALDATSGASHRLDPDAFVAGDPLPFESAVPEGVRLPSVMEPGSLRGRGEVVRAPTFGILVRLRAAVDSEDRTQRLSERLGDDMVPRVEKAVAGGLSWLAARRADDGRWGPLPENGAEDVRDGVTAAVVLAFVQNGYSAHSGEYAATLVPAIAALEKRLRDGPAARDVKPVYSHALALRALAWEWALDFRHLERSERESRQRLLASAGR